MDQTVAIGTLKVGERFALIDRTFQITGTVKVQSKGYTAVKIDGSDKFVTIGDRQFEAKGTSTAEWTKSVQVYKLKEEDGEEDMDAVPISSDALNGAGEPIPIPRPVPTPASFALTKPKQEKIVASKTKIKDDTKAQERIRLAELRNKEKAKKAKAVAGPDGQKGPKPLNNCRCGCGGQTKNQFNPGHDARFYGWAKKIVAGKLSPDEVPNAAARAELATKAKAAKVLENHG